MKTFGFGIKGFASGFQTGIGLGLENKKIKMIQEEQKRAEKLAKEKEENAMNWYNTNKDSLTNFHTQSQDIRNMLIFESVQYKKEWTDYLRDAEDFIQSGDIEGLKHLNDIQEEKIKAERDMLGIGVRPENAFIGKYYSEKDMEYVKKLQMGKLINKPIGTQMYEEQFGKLPEVVPKLTDTQVKLAEIDKLTFLTEERRNKMKVQLLVKDSTWAEKVKDAKAAGATDEDIVKMAGGGVIGAEPTKVTPEGEITAGEKRKIDVEKDYRETAKEILYGERDYMGMPTSIGIIPMDMQMNIAMGTELTNEEKQAILNNYNLRKETFNESVKKYVESILNQLGVLGVTTPTPKVTPEITTKKTGIIQSIKDWWKGLPTGKEKTEIDYWTEKYGF